MLVMSEPPEFNVTLSSVETWKIFCCICSPARQHNDSVVVDSDLPKRLARRGIALEASAALVMYGSLLQQGGRSVGPAVFFHSPLALESHSFHLRVPVDGVKPSCDNCRVVPFIGAYDQNLLSYMFQSSQSMALLHSDRDRRSDPRHIVIAVRDTVIFRPFCITEQADPSPCCPAFEYEIRLYQSRSTVSMGRKISVVVFIKSRLWNAVSVRSCVCCTQWL